LQGLGLAFGTRYVGKRNTLETTLELPAYQVFDAAAYYRIDKFQLSVNLNNFTNKTHWVGGYAYNRLFPGTPRNFLVSVGYTF
jgi:iron complex outermembrane receptor protein